MEEDIEFVEGVVVAGCGDDCTCAHVEEYVVVELWLLPCQVNRFWLLLFTWSLCD